MTRKQIQREKSKLEQRLADLTKEEKGLEKDPVREVADVIHAAFCKQNHDDGCSWCYESWDTANTTRQRYVKKAIELLRLTNKDALLEIIDVLGRY